MDNKAISARQARLDMKQWSESEPIAPRPHQIGAGPKVPFTAHPSPFPGIPAPTRLAPVRSDNEAGTTTAGFIFAPYLAFRSANRRSSYLHQLLCSIVPGLGWSWGLPTPFKIKSSVG